MVDEEEQEQEKVSTEPKEPINDLDGIEETPYKTIKLVSGDTLIAMLRMITPAGIIFEQPVKLITTPIPNTDKCAYGVVRYLEMSKSDYILLSQPHIISVSDADDDAIKVYLGFLRENKKMQLEKAKMRSSHEKKASKPTMMDYEGELLYEDSEHPFKTGEEFVNLVENTTSWLQ